MNISPALLGAIRSVAILAGWAAINAVLTYFTNAANFNGIFSPAITSVIVLIASAIEHNMESSTGKAMFGAVRTN